MVGNKFVRWTWGLHAARASGGSRNIHMGVSGGDPEEERELR